VLDWINVSVFITSSVILGSLLDIVLAIRPEVTGFKLAEDDGILRAIKIRSTTSFGGEVKPSAPMPEDFREC
jgi:hypothetical protein